MVKTLKEVWRDYWLLCLVLFWACFALLANIMPSPEPNPTAVIYDGQSAILTNDITIHARIPFQGESLYEGKVLFRKGTMLVKPRVE